MDLPDFIADDTKSVQNRIENFVFGSENNVDLTNNNSISDTNYYRNLTVDEVAAERMRKGITLEEWGWIISANQGNEENAKRDLFTKSATELRTMINSMKTYAGHVEDELSGGDSFLDETIRGEPEILNTEYGFEYFLQQLGPIAEKTKEILKKAWELIPKKERNRTVFYKLFNEIYNIYNQNITEYDEIFDVKEFVDNSFNIGPLTIGNTYVYDEDKHAVYKHIGIHLMPYSIGPQLSQGNVYNVSEVDDYGKHFLDFEFMNVLDGFVHSRWPFSTEEGDEPMVWSEGTSDGLAFGPGIGYDFYIPLSDEWVEGTINVHPWTDDIPTLWPVEEDRRV